MNDDLDIAIDPTLGDLVDENSFAEVCGGYFKLFEMPIRVFDAKGNLVAEAAQSTYPVCKRFCEEDTARKICIATRMKVKSTLPDDKRLTSVDCLCGLRYTAAPIKFQSSVIGKLVFGPFRPTDQEREQGKIYDGDSAIDLTATKALLSSMRQTRGSVIRKIATAMLSVLDAVLFSAHKSLVTSQMHLASVQESHKALAKKNQELEEMHEQMKAFERLKSNFLSTVSHELRTPLTSIIGYSDMLSEGIAGNLDDDQKQFIQTIKTKGEELLKLISAILDFSQIESGHLNLQKRHTHPKALLEAAIKEIEKSAERRGIRLVTTYAEDLKPVSLDPEKIRSAVGHLIDNAVKFSSPGAVVKVSVQVTASEQDSEDDEDGVGFVLMTAPDWLDISVEDYGEGIPEQDQERIFTPFTQLDDSTTREHGGSGLGLAVVKQFVEAHGGKVGIQSTPSEGSNFTIRLPIMPTE